MNASAPMRLKERVWSGLSTIVRLGGSLEQRESGTSRSSRSVEERTPSVASPEKRIHRGSPKPRLRTDPRGAAQVAILACLTLFSSAPAGAAELFGPAAVSFQVALTPVGVAVADLDADGAMDLAVATTYGDSVSILLGDGLGGFSRTPDIAVGDGPTSIAAGNFDADGAEDLVVANGTGNSVSILLGDGRGGFVRTPDLELGDGPAAVAAGDFNADDSADLVVANAGSNSVSILLGNGRGGFVHARDIAVGNGPVSVVIGDFNTDGASDLAVVNRDSDSVGILLGDGRAAFVPTPDLSVGDEPVSIAVGDFDSDGVADLAVANSHSHSVSMLLGDGRGGFVHVSDIAVSAFPRSVAVADFDADGAQDLAVTSPELVSILLGDGLGGFVRVTDIEAQGPPMVAVGDFNADNAADLVVPDYVNAVTVLLSDGLGGFVRAPGIAVGRSPGALAMADFDADGAMDLAVTDHLSNSVAILLGDRRGGFLRTPDITVGEEPLSVAVGDFNSDDAADLAVANSGPFLDPGPDTVSILLGDGHGGFVRSADLPVGDSPKSIAVEDFNDDGAADLVVANEFGNSVTIVLGDGHGGFVRTPDITVGDHPLSVAAGDFDGDGAVDLAIANSYSHSVSVLLGDRRGGFIHASDIGVGVFPRSVVVTDFDADGATDLAVVDSGLSSVCILRGDGRGGFVWTRCIQGNYPVSVVVGDFNADGVPDLAVGNFSSSVSILLGDGMGTFVRAPDIAVEQLPWSVSIGDFNADGAQDLAVANRGGNVSILSNQLADRADTNGSNRIDGFDVAAVSRIAGTLASECEFDPACAYRRTADVDLNGIVDGDDLAFVTSHFGKLVREGSPLRGTLAGAAPSAPRTVVLREAASEGDLLTVEILANGGGQAAAAADFTLTFNPVPHDAGRGQVLEVAGFDPGTFLSGGAGQVYSVDTSTPGAARIQISRLPNSDQTTAGAESLLSLFLRSRREGEAVLDFAPNGLPAPALVTATGQAVPGIHFAGGAAVEVTSSSSGAPGQRISAGPSLLDLGVAPAGGTSRKVLRVSNFGFSELTVTGVASTLDSFTTYFSSAFTVPPFGFVDLPVVFAPIEGGFFSGELVLSSDDPRHPEYRAPIVGYTDRELLVTPTRLDFGTVLVGSEKALRLRLANRATATRTRTSCQSSDAAFVVQPGFTAIDPGQSGEVVVRFRPVANGEAHGLLTLTLAGAGTRTVAVGLSGLANSPGTSLK